MYKTIKVDSEMEQYDLFKDEKQVAYFRVMDGQFTVEHPNFGDKILYTKDLKHKLNTFEDENERIFYLRIGKEKLDKELNPTKNESPFLDLKKTKKDETLYYTCMNCDNRRLTTVGLQTRLGSKITQDMKCLDCGCKQIFTYTLTKKTRKISR